MTRRLPAIAPFVDFYGRPTYDNPAGQNRPNPALTTTTQPAPIEPAPIAQPAVVALAEVAAETTAVTPIAINDKRDPALVRAELAAAVAHYHAQTAQAATPASTNAHAVRVADPAVGTRAQRAAQQLAQRRIRLHRNLRRTAVAMLAVIGVLGTSAGAYAYWSASGSGTGKAAATATTFQTVTLAATTTSGTALIPGGTGNLALSVTNPNHFTIKITGIQQGVGTITVTGGTGCTSSNSGVSVPTVTGLSNTVAPGTHTVNLSTAAAMSTSSVTGCQNATFSIPVTVTVQQQ